MCADNTFLHFVTTSQSVGRLPDTGYASPSTTAGTYVASASSGRRRNDENGFDVGDYEHRDKQGSSSNLDNHQHYILPTKLPSQGGKRYRVKEEPTKIFRRGSSLSIFPFYRFREARRRRRIGAAVPTTRLRRRRARTRSSSSGAPTSQTRTRTTTTTTITTTTTSTPTTTTSTGRSSSTSLSRPISAVRRRPRRGGSLRGRRQS